MVNVLLQVFLWATLIGFVTFCLLYVILTSPWQDHMGRHVLLFMGGLTIAFVYAAISKYIDPEPRLIGWTLVLVMTTALVWWRVYILIIYQFNAQKVTANDNVKDK